MTLYCGIHTWLCVQKMLNHGFCLSLFKLISCPIHWICMCVSLFKFQIWIFRAVLVLPKTAGSAQTYKSMSFIWIVWSTLYVYLCPHLASWQEARKAIHSSNLLLVSSWEKKRKDWEKKKPRNQVVFFAIKPVQIIWEVLTPP